MMVLFTGPSGTGKTMVAEVLAHMHGYDLYMVDLSALGSKYIGETEENPSQIFEDAGAPRPFRSLTRPMPYAASAPK